MIKQLQELGLSEKEAMVYLALLELGQAAVQDISKRAGVNRATTYVILEALAKRGLASRVEKDKKTFFIAERPEQLLRLIRKQERELKEREKEFLKQLPELVSLFETAGERPTVRFFDGKAGLEVIKDEILKTKDKQLEAVFSADDLERVFSKEEREEYFKRRVKKGIRVKAIYTRVAGPFEKIAPIDELRIVPRDLFPLSVDITIYSNKIAISSLKGKLIGVIIENASIVQTFRSLFYLAWEAAGTYKK